jgi:predicted Rossmann fold flavoprotein
MLLEECAAAGVELRLAHRITAVSRAERFRVETDRGVFEAPALVLATGGLSIPKLGATGLSYDIARQFGLALTEIRPALVPLTFSAADLTLMQPLSGVALDCTVSCGRQSFREAMLLTHRGLSGPAILQISSYWREGREIVLDIAPGEDAAAFLRAGKRSRSRAEPATVLAGLVPARLAAAFAAGLPKRPLGEIPDRLLTELGEKLNRWRLTPSGTEGYVKAEVTLGGVDTAGLSSRTMEAASVPGLFVIGEAVDVTGWLGGYNFQWAWSSGRAAGEAV